MGKASRSKNERRHLTDAEKARREEQARKASKDTEQRDRRGVVVLDDPTVAFVCRYDFNIPGGPLRSNYPVRLAGKIAANTEADLLRDLILTYVEAVGWQKFGRASAGLLAEAINSFPQSIRQEVFRMIAQGAGVNVFATEVTTCKACGAEKEVVSLIDTSDSPIEEQDVTVHDPGCPTLPQVDTAAIASDENAGEGEPPMRPGVPVEWYTGPAVMVDNPMKFRPLYAPQEQSPQEQEQQEQQTTALPEGKLDEVIELPVPDGAAVCAD